MSSKLTKNCLKMALILTAMSAAVSAHDLPWHLGSLNPADSAPAAINTVGVKPGPHEVVVAVIDSGVLPNHPSLKGRLLPGYDMISGSNNLRGTRSADYTPDLRDAKCGERLSSSAYRTHGTEISSLIAGNGAEGVYGVNPTAKIVPVRLFGACRTSRADLLDAIAWSAGLPVEGVPANAHPAKVINLSFYGGKNTCGADLQALVNKLNKKNIFIVAAAGNSFGRKLMEPANCDGVVSVGAIDPENNIANYSALDPRTVVYAPGGGRPLPSDTPWHHNRLQVATYDLNLFGEETPKGEERGMGTSYSAALVSGFVSLVLSNNTEFTHQQFIQKLTYNSRIVNKTAKCYECEPKGLAMTASY
jgi:subtilisin family serine protease